MRTSILSDDGIEDGGFAQRVSWLCGRVEERLRTMHQRPPPSGEKWADLKYLEPVRDYRPRHTSTLLVFDAVAEALDKAGAR